MPNTFKAWAPVALLTVAGAIAAAGPTWAQRGPAAHVHGQVQANVAVQGNKLSVQLEIPLDSLLGFEHRPRTTAQRQAAAAAVQQLKSAAAWLKPDAAALCTLSSSDINTQALEPAKPDTKKQEPAQDHADVDAAYEFTCAAPDKLAGLDIGLMAVFKRIQRIDVQVAGAKTQSKQTLRQPASRVLLVR